MKTRKAIVFRFVLIAALVTALPFVLYPDRDAGFWIAWAFALLGVAVYFCLILYTASVRFEKMPWRLPLIAVGRLHMILALVLSALYFPLAIALNLPESLSASGRALYLNGFWLLHAILLAVAALRVNALHIGASLIDAVRESQRDRASGQRALTAEARILLMRTEKLPPEAREIARKSAEKLAEALRYADPVAPGELAGLDEGIRAALARLGDALEHPGNFEAADFTARAEALLLNIRERNERVAAAKTRAR